MNYKNIKSILLIALPITLTFLFVDVKRAHAQIDIGADLNSRYLWRGLEYSTAPVIQPSISFTSGNLELGAWGSYSFIGSDGSELDFYASYTLGPVVLTFTDYFFPADRSTPADYSGDGNHVFEAMLGVDVGPLNIVGALNVLNDDSFYGNISFPIGGDVGGVIGVASGNYYLTSERSFGCVEIGIDYSKDIKITEKYFLAASTTLVYNPDNDGLHLVFGVSF